MSSKSVIRADTGVGSSSCPTKVLHPALKDDIAVLIHQLRDFPKLVVGEALVPGDGTIRQPQLRLPIAGQNMDVRRLSTLVRVERELISPDA